MQHDYIAKSALPMMKNINLLKRLIMAIINSGAIGKATRSLLNITYRTFRGKTYASGRITENKSHTPAQERLRIAFSEVNHLALLFTKFLEEGFKGSRWKTPRNGFVHFNDNYLNYLRAEEDPDFNLTPLYHLAEIMKGGDYTDGLQIGGGSYKVTLTCGWDTDGLPRLLASYTVPYEAGDVLFIGQFVSYYSHGGWQEEVRYYERALGPIEIAGFPLKNQAVIDKALVPELEKFTELLPGASNATHLVGVTVIRNKKGSVCHVGMMPDTTYQFNAASQTLEPSGDKMAVTAPDAEAFAKALYDGALGAIMDTGSEIMANRFKVVDFKMGTDSRPIGLVFEQADGRDFMTQLMGSPVGPIPLIKDGATLAIISGLFNPDMLS